jgi:hypothetical protein
VAVSVVWSTSGTPVGGTCTSGSAPPVSCGAVTPGSSGTDGSIPSGDGSVGVEDVSGSDGSELVGLDGPDWDPPEGACGVDPPLDVSEDPSEPPARPPAGPAFRPDARRAPARSPSVAGLAVPRCDSPLTTVECSAA